MTAVVAAAILGNPRTARGRLPPSGEGATRVRAPLAPTETTAAARVDGSQATAIRAVAAVPPLPTLLHCPQLRPASATPRPHTEEREGEIRRFKTAVVEGLGRNLFHLHLQCNDLESQVLCEVGTASLQYLLQI